MKFRDVKSVDYDGPLRFERVDPAKYIRIRREWWHEFALDLPPPEDLPKFGRPSEVRILFTPSLDVRLGFRDRGDILYRFFRGFMTDLASVPRGFRSVVDNDDLRLLLAALVHDRNFTTHSVGFGSANRIFYGMIREAGYPVPRAVTAYLAVNSIFGRARYEKTPARDPWTEKTSEIIKF